MPTAEFRLIQYTDIPRGGQELDQQKGLDCVRLRSIVRNPDKTNEQGKHEQRIDGTKLLRFTEDEKVGDPDR